MIRYCLLIGTLLLSAGCSDTPPQIPAYKVDFCSRIHFAQPGGLEKELAPLRDSMAAKTGAFVLEEGDAAMMTRAWLCEHAEKTIDVQYFIFATDNVGLIACDYLVCAADRGVKVRILIDDILVNAGPYEILTLDSHPNIDIRIYNPGINIGKSITGKLSKLVTDFKGANQRMHNKTFTVDGQVVITGGRNIADEYFDYDHEFNFRDRDVLLLGPVVQRVHESFEDYWASTLSVPITKLVADTSVHAQDGHRFARLHQYACNPDNFWPQVREGIQNLPETFHRIIDSGRLVWTDSIAFVADEPGKNKSVDMHGGGRTTDTLMALVRNAQHTVDIQSPYLVVTEEGIALLADAVTRGVRIRILTNSLASNDNLQSFAGYQKVRERLLRAGVKIYEFKPDAKERYSIMTGALQKKMNYTPIFGLHAKGMVVDGETTVIGTFNMDPRSANLNTECITIIRSAKLSAGVLRGMEEELKPENAWETTLTYNPDKEATVGRRVKTWTLKALPQSIL
jgi:cardiolipin synthase C